MRGGVRRTGGLAWKLALRSQSTAAAAAQTATAGYQRGQSLGHNWTVADVTSCPELNLSSVVRLEHAKCGAQWLHLACPGDETNAFSVHFKTVPRESTGVAHILEHVSLCGSQK